MKHVQHLHFFLNSLSSYVVWLAGGYIFCPSPLGKIYVDLHEISGRLSYILDLWKYYEVYAAVDTSFISMNTVLRYRSQVTQLNFVLLIVRPSTTLGK